MKNRFEDSPWSKTNPNSSKQLTKAMEVIDDFVYSVIDLTRDGMVPEIWVDSQYLQSDSSIVDGAEMLRARLWIDENPWEEGVEPITRRCRSHGR